MPKRKKPYSKMNAKELAAATKQFEREILLEDTKPLTPAMRAWWEKARRGRPRVGKGSKPVTITVEQSLLQEADAYARMHGIKRSELIAHGLKLAMASRG